MTKRFIIESVMIDCLCEDEPRIAKVITGTDENYSYEELYEVAELLNEQQATIPSLQREIEELGISIKLFEDDIATKDKKIVEQQATIKKLQDLCGKSDYENAKLRLKNKELQEKIRLLKPVNIEQYEQIVQLQDENEQLRLEWGTHKHPLWSTREAERKLSEVTNNLADEIKKNGLLNEELNQLRIENMRLKKKGSDIV